MNLRVPNAPFGRPRHLSATPFRVTLGSAITAWSVVVVAQFLGLTTLTSSPPSVDALLLGPPLGLAVVWLMSTRRVDAALQWATGWTSLLAAVLLLTPMVIATPSLAYTIPGLLILAWLVAVRPAACVTTMLAVTASFGSLSIYLSWPYKRTLVALLAAMALAAIARLLVQRRLEPLRLPAALLLTASYLTISIAQVILSSDPGVALGGFQLAPLYMTTLLVVAYSLWSDQTHERILRALIWIAVIVGAYATLRQIVGPSAAEAREAALSPYNFVDGKRRLIGSFLEGPELAGWTALLIPLCLSLALGARGRLRLAACLALPLLVVGLFGSQARVGAVAVGIAALLTIVLHGAAPAFPALRLGRTIASLGVMAALVLGAYALAGSSSQGSGHSYLSLLKGNQTDASLAAHKYKWTQAFQDLAGHPFGYGLGTAPAGYVANAPTTPSLLKVTGFSVDNGFLKVALEQGLTVMLVFAAALGAIAFGLVRAGLSTTDPSRATLAIGAAGTAVSFFVLEGAGVYADGIPSVAGWAVLGLGIAQASRIRAERGPPAQERAS